MRAVIALCSAVAALNVLLKLAESSLSFVNAWTKRRKTMLGLHYKQANVESTSPTLSTHPSICRSCSYSSASQSSIVE
jgi:hypothetical protein